ncbi:MAG: class I SAM-dependent methyltransferase [Sulfuricellaceae bacterium]|jgi:SAM-dependent methyltransferase
MNPAEYDAWYGTPRGHWIGRQEFTLILRKLGPAQGETLLDVGCGTGWFTRAFAAAGLAATGLDVNLESLAYAHERGGTGITWVAGDGERLPFQDGCFDCAVSIATLCFVPHERAALAEILRVTRRRFAVGWLNRASLLYRQKGRHGGSGAYRGARWHTAGEIRALFDGLPVRNLTLRSAIFLPDGGPTARVLERLLPSRLPWGSLLVATGEPIQPQGDNPP